jgi:hypothetical protein
MLSALVVVRRSAHEPRRVIVKPIIRCSVGGFDQRLITVFQSVVTVLTYLYFAFFADFLCRASTLTP